MKVKKYRKAMVTRFIDRMVRSPKVIDRKCSWG
jgi:hypothetical protein